MKARVVVLDDDPTGTQCASAVTVALDPHPAALAAFDDTALYVLTNTRAMNAPAAAATVRGVMAGFAGRTDLPAVFVLRGDSTLRGHIATEMHELGLARGVGLIVPAYPAAGRVTVDGVHYLQSGEVRTNVADTEFASDPVFGFVARTMADWIRDSGTTNQVIGVGLPELRKDGPAALAGHLARAPLGSVVVPDVETDTDIDIIAAGFWRAVDAGLRVIARCAAPLAATIAKRPGRVLRTREHAAEKTLVVCGSHTAAASRQLHRLAGDGLPVRTLPTAELLAGCSAAEAVVADTVAAASGDLDTRGLAILATERSRLPENHTLDHGARVMKRLTQVVSALSGQVDAVVSKGGITSAEVATNGLGGSSAVVRGQLLTGVSLLEVRCADDRVMPLVVVPGNVGQDDTLVAVCEFLGAQGPRKTRGFRAGR